MVVITMKYMVLSTIGVDMPSVMAEPVSTGQASEWLRPAGVALEYPLSENTLATLRFRGQGPRYSKPGGRIVMYRRSDIESWLEAHMRETTD